MFTETISTSAQFALPGTIKPQLGITSPAFNAGDYSDGTTVVTLHNGDDVIIPLTRMTPYINDNGVLSIQGSAATYTAAVTTLPLSQVLAAKAALDAGGAAPTVLWDAVTITGAQDIINLPLNASGLYLAATGDVTVVVRRT